MRAYIKIALLGLVIAGMTGCGGVTAKPSSKDGSSSSLSASEAECYDCIEHNGEMLLMSEADYFTKVQNGSRNVACDARAYVDTYNIDPKYSQFKVLSTFSKVRKQARAYACEDKLRQVMKNDSLGERSPLRDLISPRGRVNSNIAAFKDIAWDDIKDRWDTTIVKNPFTTRDLREGLYEYKFSLLNRGTIFFIKYTTMQELEEIQLKLIPFYLKMLGEDKRVENIYISGTTKDPFRASFMKIDAYLEFSPNTSCAEANGRPGVKEFYEGKLTGVSCNKQLFNDPDDTLKRQCLLKDIDCSAERIAKVKAEVEAEYMDNMKKADFAGAL